MCLPMFRPLACANAAALVILVAFGTYGCGKKEDNRQEAAQSNPTNQQPPETSPQEPLALPDISGQERFSQPEAPQISPAPQNPSLGAPAWGAAPERRSWANAVIGVVRNRMTELERARDVEVFCPGYRQSSPSQRQNCWLLIVAAISKFESNFHPGDSFREPNGTYSVGLLALSPGECANAPSLSALKSPVANLVCGTNKMAGLIGKHGYIDGPANGRGASRYWSTLRAPYKRWDPTRNRYLNLGKRNLILPLVRSYRGRSGLQAVSRLGEAKAFVDGMGYVDAADFRGLQEEREADAIAAMPVELDGFGYHDEE